MDKPQTLLEHVAQVIGGTPLAVLTKTSVAAFTMLWSHFHNVGTVVLLYCILVVVDVIMGVALARAKGKEIKPGRWISGPAKKIGFTAFLFLGASVIDTIIPGEFVLYGMSGYVAAALFLDVAKKYDLLTGLNVLTWLEDRVGSLLRRKDG
jgi:energy-converting hydrogenase Eha subunit C